MTLTQIKYFIVAEKYMNFTKAANELYTTQPTISKQIDSLEKELGFKLFDRTSNKMKLTPSGEIMLIEFQNMIESLEKAKYKAKQLHYKNRGHLNIGFPTSMKISCLLPDVFKLFTEQHPDIILELYTYDFKNLRTKLLEDSLDLIFTVSFDKIGQDSKHINKLPISRSRPRIYYNKKSLNKLNRATIEDLKNVPLILLKNDGTLPGNEYVVTLALKYGLNTTNVITANTLETMFLYIESGYGVAILGSSYQISESDNICYLELSERKNPVGTDMFWKSETKNPSIDLFIKYMTHFLKTTN